MMIHDSGLLFWATPVKDISLCPLYQTQRIEHSRDAMTMRCINLLFAYLLTYLLTYPVQTCSATA